MTLRAQLSQRPFLPHSNLSPNQEQLKSILASPAHPAVWLLGDGRRRKVAAGEALLLIRGDRYEWSGTKRRVRALRPLALAPVWQPCYRTTAAAVLPPSIEWCWSLRNG